MAKNKNKKKQRTEVFMQIHNPAKNEKYILKVPKKFQSILNSLMPGQAPQDFHNSREILQFFCEQFVELDDKSKCDFEAFLNSEIVKVDTISDMVVLLLQMNKYYRIVGADSYAKLGSVHILATQMNDPESWIAKCPMEEAEKVGKSVQCQEGGRFFHGDYIGRYCCILENKGDD